MSGKKTCCPDGVSRKSRRDGSANDDRLLVSVVYRLVWSMAAVIQRGGPVYSGIVKKKLHPVMAPPTRIPNRLAATGNQRHWLLGLTDDHGTLTIGKGRDMAQHLLCKRLDLRGVDAPER